MVFFLTKKNRSSIFFIDGIFQIVGEKFSCYFKSFGCIIEIKLY